eukprot:gene23177-30389_t
MGNGEQIAAKISEKLNEALEAEDVQVVDTSGGCGLAYEVFIVSPKFEGLSLIQRHRLINGALEEEMQQVHAMSIKKCWTPAQQAASTK